MKDWIEHFRDAAKGLVIAYVWRGYGSALFIEFGALMPTAVTRKDGTPGAPSGEIGLMSGTDWRIEDANTIVCGSGSDKGLWEATFGRLVGQHVVDVAMFGRLPEILISLSDGRHVASFSIVEGDPEWALFGRRNCEEITVGC